MPPRAKAITAADFFAGLVDRLFVVAAILLAGICAYYVWACFSAAEPLFRGIGPNQKALSVAVFRTHYEQTVFLTRLLLLATVVTVAGALLRHYDNPVTGVILLLAGIGVFLGMSFLVTNIGEPIPLPPRLARVGDPGKLLLTTFRVAGLILLVPGFIHMVVELAVELANSRNRRPKVDPEADRIGRQRRAVVRHDKFLGPCWTTPFCQEAGGSGEICPVHKAKKPCWRTGRGCYCDKDIAILAVKGGKELAALANQLDARGAGGLPTGSPVRGGAKVMARPKTLAERRAHCLSCPIYLHRQSQKYKLLSPLTLTTTILLLVVFWGGIIAGYRAMMQGVVQLITSYSFGMGSPHAQWAHDLVWHPAIMWMLLLVGALLLVAYAMQLIEWSLYRMGL